MKKNLLRIVCILMALFMLPVHAFAAEAPAQEEALTGAAAINYVQKNADFVGSEYRTVTTSQNGLLELRGDTYTKTTATDVTTAAMARSGDTATNYETTTYKVWSARAGGSASSEGGDDYGYAMMTLTVNYTTSTYSGITTRRMTRVAGTYTLISSGAEMSSQNYYIQESGTSSTGAYINRYNTYSLSRTQRSWSASVSSSTFPGIEVLPSGVNQFVNYNFVLSLTETGSTLSDRVQVNLMRQA